MNCLIYWEAKIISFDFPILKHPLDMMAFLFNSQLCQKISFDECILIKSEKFDFRVQVKRETTSVYIFTNYHDIHIYVP